MVRELMRPASWALCPREFCSRDLMRGEKSCEPLVPGGSHTVRELSINSFATPSIGLTCFVRSPSSLAKELSWRRALRPWISIVEVRSAETHYSVLGVPETATQGEIEQAYEKRTEAYRVLSDPNRRADYDRQLAKDRANPRTSLPHRPQSHEDFRTQVRLFRRSTGGFWRLSSLREASGIC